MEYPVCLEGRHAGTLYVCPEGDDVALRAVCGDVTPGLYRLYLRGSGGEAALGVTEDGCLRRRFSRELLAPAGDIRCAELRPCGGGEVRPQGFLACLPPGAKTARRGGQTEATIPWREGSAFPLPQLFCFARVVPGGAVYLFDGAGRPVMPKI